MKNNATESLCRWRRRALGALGALMIAASALAVTASVASAETLCNSSSQANTCMTIVGPGQPGVKLVHVGIDVYMSQQDAQAIIDGGGWFWVVVYGADPGNDQYLFPLPIKEGWPAAGVTSLSAEFETLVGQSELDENVGRDEVYARILLFDPRTGLTRTFFTPTFYHWY